MSRTIPVPTEPLLARNGAINPIWYRYLRGLTGEQSLAGVIAAIERLGVRVTKLEDSEGAEVTGDMSIVAVDTPTGRALRLSGDVQYPGRFRFYATDANAIRQWTAISEILSASNGIVFTDSGYVVMGSVDAVEDLPASGESGQAWWVGNTLYAWDGSEWIPDYEPSGVMALELVPGQNPGDTLLWDGDGWGVGQPPGGDIDGGQAASVYTAAQRIDGGAA